MTELEALGLVETVTVGIAVELLVVTGEALARAVDAAETEVVTLEDTLALTVANTLREASGEGLDKDDLLKKAVAEELDEALDEEQTVAIELTVPSIDAPVLAVAIITLREALGEGLDKAELLKRAVADELDEALDEEQTVAIELTVPSIDAPALAVASTLKEASGEGLDKAELLKRAVAEEMDETLDKELTVAQALGMSETDINDVALSELVLEGVVRGLHELAEEGEAKGDEVVLEEADTEAQALPDGVK